MEISEWLLFIPPLVSFMAVWWIYFRILKVAKVKGLVDNPDARKLQKIPIPVLGGLAVFFGVAFGLLSATDELLGACSSVHGYGYYAVCGWIG